jgi:hypothetical protein
MQQIDFSNANLGSLNLSQGRLRGAKLDATDLVNAVFVGADLTATPDMIASSLVQANLQGADFTATKLGGANLSNAAVSLADGVVLFSSPAALAPDLDRRELSAEVVGAFSQSGTHLVDCSDPAVIVDQTDSRWQIWLGISVGPSGARFEKFSLTVSPGVGQPIQVSGLSSAAPRPLFTADRAFAATLDKKRLASGLIAAFRSHSYPLPPCLNPSIDVVQPGKRWTVGESLSVITVAGLGYTGFNLVVEGPTPATQKIQTYGSEVTIIRRDEGGSLTLVPIPLVPTKLTESAFDNNTTCPNQKSYGANKASGATWQQMMTAVHPPAPPACIPSPTHWCN